MKTLIWLSAVFATALALSGCGGGGGGSAPASSTSPPVATTPGTPTSPGTPTTPTTPTTPAAPTASLTLVSVTPGASTTGVPTKGTVTIVASYQDAGTFDQKSLDVSCGGHSVMAGSPTILVDKPNKGQVSYLLDYDASYDFLFSCDVSGSLIAKGVSGATDPTPVIVTDAFTITPVCTAPNKWSNGNIVCTAPVGTWLVGAPLLPAGCTDTTKACFLSTAKFAATGIVIGGRPVMVAFFQNPGPLWRMALLFTDDGTLVSYPWNNAIGGYATPVDKLMGTATGVVIESGGLCLAGNLDIASQQMVLGYVPCPS